MTATTATDEQIVEQALGGDREAFGELVRRWERKIFSLSFGMLGSAEEARDATQETSSRPTETCRASAASRRSRRGCTASPSTSASPDRGARVRSETGIEDESLAAGERFLATPEHASPAHSAEKKQRREAVRKAVSSLPPELREVVVLKEFEDLTFQEIADALQIPLSTVKSRLYTALKQLRMRLGKFSMEVAPQ